MNFKKSSILCALVALVCGQDPCVPIGNDCLPAEEIQRCSDYLGTLSQDTDSVDNECIPEVVDIIGGGEAHFSVESRFLNVKPSGLGQTLAENTRDAFNNAPTNVGGYCYTENPVMPTSNQNLCGAATNIAWKYTIQFDDPEPASYVFDFGLDIGDLDYTGATGIFVDGDYVYDSNNVGWYWANNWNLALRQTYSFNSGSHEILIYGHEACCDGAYNIRFSRNGGAWQTLSEETLVAAVPAAESDKQSYNFHLNYVNGFVFDDDCLDQEVTFQSLTFPEGGAQFDQWQFDVQNQEITFSVLHDNLEPYGCQKFTEDDQYTWQCEMALHLYFAGTEQYTYNFVMKVYLSRVYENQLDVTVNKNSVVGDCCENVLDIETTLQFCTDFTCDTKLPDNQIIERKSDIFLEHSITTQEFQYYFLHGMQIKIGAFVPEIIATNGSNPGRLIYHIQSNIAMPNMIIEAISRIDENPQSRRALQAVDEEEIGDDYKVKAVNMVEIQTENEIKNEKQEENDNNTPLIIGLGVLGGVVVLAVIGVSVHCALKQKKIRQEKQNNIARRDSTLQLQQNLQKSASSDNSDVDLESKYRIKA